MDDFASKLKEWRARKGYSQATAARKLGESVRTWQEWEQGRREPSGRAYERLCHVIEGVEKTATPFAVRLRNFRKYYGWNRDAAACELTELAGVFVSPGAIAHWEQEDRVPQSDALSRVRSILEDHEKKHGRPKQKTALERAIDGTCARRFFREVPSTPAELLTHKLEEFREVVRTGLFQGVEVPSLRRPYGKPERLKKAEERLMRLFWLAKGLVEKEQRKEERERTRKPRRKSPII